MTWRRQQHCIDCHFLVKELRGNPVPVPTLDVTREERVHARFGDYSWHKDHYAIACTMGVWDEGHNFDPSQKHAILTGLDRRNFCFFWKYRPGMLLPAARVLQERAEEERHARRDRLLTIVGLWIAVAALVVQILLQVAESRKWWLFPPQEYQSNTVPPP